MAEAEPEQDVVPPLALKTEERPISQGVQADSRGQEGNGFSSGVSRTSQACRRLGFSSLGLISFHFLTSRTFTRVNWYCLNHRVCGNFLSICVLVSVNRLQT